MSQFPSSAKDVFLAALDRDPAERAAFLNDACAGDAALQRQVEALLRVHDEPDSFLDSPRIDLGLSGDAANSDAGPTLDQPITEKPGTQIGPYKLLEQIGEGGMGVVYMAEQSEPVERRVALKIIKPGMDTRQVIGRFEAERQALAMMDHPNIAKVLDAGTTESGRPYFVMELVKGTPITQYADEHHLTPKERLELFVPVCHAVQHAHQKGIIHRDIKPSNVMVAEYDDRPVPKVIDFGVAKAIDKRLAEKTAFTHYGQIVGTIGYMSPEQARLNQFDIDTRSDIYSLGVVLYELLSGETPFDRQRLRSAAFDEMLRIIREEEPSKPSTKVSSSQALPSIAANRRTEPAKLSGMIRGELDWIVLKAMEKDRGRRYDTASKFAEDVQHYLNDEAVVACPPSAGYKFRKFARRNKVAIATTTAVALALIVGSTAATWQAIRATRAESLLRGQYEREQTQRAKENERRAALNRQINDGLLELQQQLTEAERLGVERPEAWVDARRVAERVQALSENELADENSVARVGRFLARLDDQERDGTLLARCDEARLKQAEIDTGGYRFARERAIPVYGAAFEDYGFVPGTLSPREAAARIRSRSPAVQMVIISSLADWAGLLDAFDKEVQASSEVRDWIREVIDAADEDPWRKQMRTALQEEDFQVIAQLAADIDVRSQPATTLIVVGTALCRKDEHWDAGIALLQRAQRAYPNDFWVNQTLSAVYIEKEPAIRNGRIPPKGELIFANEIALYSMIAVAIRPNTAVARLHAGAVYHQQGNYEAAIAEFREAIAMDRGFAIAHHNLGDTLQVAGQVEEAIGCYRKAIRLNPAFVDAHSGLGTALLDTGRIEEATACFEEVLRLNPEFPMAHYNLGIALGKKRLLDAAIAQFRLAIEQDPSHAEAHCNLGLALNDQQQWDSAISEFRQALELTPQLYNAHYGLGNALQVQGKLDEAIEHYHQAIKHNPGSAHSHVHLGVALDAQGKLDEATNCFRKAIELDPTVAVAHYNLGRMLQHQGKAEKAIECYRKAIELDPEDSDAHNNLACILADQGHLEEAVRHNRKTVELDPEDIRARRNLAKTLMKQGEMQEAVDHIRKIIELDPKDATAHNYLGAALHQQGKADEAVEHIRRAIGLNPGSAEAHVNLGLVLVEQCKLAEAITHYRKAVELVPNNAAIHYQLAIALMDDGKREESVEYLRKTIALDVHFSRNLFDHARKLDSAGRRAEAIECARVLTASLPEEPALFNFLGLMLKNAKRWKEAEAAFQRCIELDPENSVAPSSLAGLYLEQEQPERALALMDDRKATWPVLRGPALRQLGRLDEAIDCFRQGLEEYKPKPDKLQFCREQLALALLDKASQVSLRPERTSEDLDHAEQLAREALRVAPENGARGWAVLGLVQYRLGQLDDAKVSLGKTLQLNPEHPYALLTRSLIDLDAGEWEAATARWKKATGLLAKRKSVSTYVKTLQNEVKARLNLPEDGLDHEKTLSVEKENQVTPPE